MRKKILIGWTRNERVLKGKISAAAGQNVIVKTWDFLAPPHVGVALVPVEIHYELNLLRKDFIQSEESVMKLIGFHCENILAVVYEGRPYKVLSDILDSDKFEWKDRMTRQLDVFHTKDLLYEGIDSRCILIDENYCPKLFNFSTYSTFNEWEDTLRSLFQWRFGYEATSYLPGPKWCKENDVFTYGILLLELITKQSVCKGGPTADWMKEVISGLKESVVHESFVVNEKWASDITGVVVRCLRRQFKPSITSIMSDLHSLVRHTKQHKA